MENRMKKLLAVLAIVTLVACDATNTVAPEATVKEAPTQVANSRYILISGVWTCVEGCEEGEN
jgi:hypothetical protein